MVMTKEEKAKNLLVLQALLEQVEQLIRDLLEQGKHIQHLLDVASGKEDE